MSHEPASLLRLGVLDLCPGPAGTTAQAALFACFEQAVHAEALGYSRYWLAEHHGPGTTHSCPELLVALIAQLTSRIRVGTAGILLNYMSPLKVAKEFRLLQALFPSRIDLGVGAGRVDDETARALLGSAAPAENYAEKVSSLVAYLRDQKRPIITPGGVGSPEVWVLGSGGLGSALTAARVGAAYSLALFLGKDDPGPMQAYRAQFEPSRTLSQPRCNVAVAGVCADTEREAKHLCALNSNSFIVPSVVGTPEQCRTQLREIAQRYETDEIIFHAPIARPEQRLRCYELLAGALDLQMHNTTDATGAAINGVTLPGAADSCGAPVL